MALIELADGRWIDPSMDYAPIGYFPASLAGSDGIVLWPIRPSGAQWVTLPEASTVGDERRVRVSLRMDLDGQFIGEVKDTLVGAEASFVGRAFASTPRDSHARLANRMLLNSLPAAEVQTVQNPIDPSSAGAFKLAYTIGGQLESPNRLGCFPIRPGGRFAPLKSRHSPLVLGLPVNQEITIQLKTKVALSFDASPVHLHHGDHRFERTVRRIDDGIELTCRLRVAGGVIPPQEYPEFRNWAQQVDALEYLKIEFETSDVSSTRTALHQRSEDIHGRTTQ